MEASPLRLYDINKIRLQYLHNALLDQGELFKHIGNPMDEYYILLEYNKGIDGIWIPVSQLNKYCIANMDDIVIIMSGQREQIGKSREVYVIIK